MNDAKSEIIKLRADYPDSSRGLSGLQLMIAEDLLHMRRIEDVAEKNGVTSRTIYYWLRDSRFNVYLAERESQLLQEASRRMVRLVNDASVLLDEAMRGQVELTADQKFSIEIVTKRAPKILDTALIYSRLSQLQSKLETLGE